MESQQISFGSRALARIPLPLFSNSFKERVNTSVGELKNRYGLSEYDYAWMLLCMEHFVSHEITRLLHIPHFNPADHKEGKFEVREVLLFMDNLYDKHLLPQQSIARVDRTLKERLFSQEDALLFLDLLLYQFIEQLGASHRIIPSISWVFGKSRTTREEIVQWGLIEIDPETVEQLRRSAEDEIDGLVVEPDATN